MENCSDNGKTVPSTTLRHGDPAHAYTQAQIKEQNYIKQFSKPMLSLTATETRHQEQAMKQDHKLHTKQNANNSYWIQSRRHTILHKIVQKILHQTDKTTSNSKCIIQHGDKAKY